MSAKEENGMAKEYRKIKIACSKRAKVLGFFYCLNTFKFVTFLSLSSSINRAWLHVSLFDLS